MLLHSTNGAKGGKIDIIAHSMGNMVASEALRELAAQNSGKIVDTYVMTQAAMGADAYMGDPDLPYPDPLAGYLGGNNPWFRHIDDAVGKVVNFYNPDDYALNKWELGNSFKPDLLSGPPPNGGTFMEGAPGFEEYQYIWSGPFPHGWVRFDSPNGPPTSISFPANAFEILAYLAKDRRPPVGRLSGVGGPIPADVDIRTLFGVGADHDGEFDGDIMTTRPYWRMVMSQFGLALH